MKPAAFLPFLLTASLTAQATNIMEIYPDLAGNTTTYVTRLDLNGTAGQVYQEFPKDLFRGIGDDGKSCKIKGFQIGSADQNGLTPESYVVEVRRGAATGGPDLTGTGLILNTPTLPFPFVGAGPVAFVLTTIWTTPFTAPCDEGLFLGITLSAAPSWNSDGQSVYSAYYSPPATRYVGDNPRQNAPNVAWYVQNGVALQGMIRASLRMGLIVPAPVLNLGGVDPSNTKQVGTCYGAGGLYPDISGAPRVDGLEARIRDLAHNQGNAQLFLATGFWPVPGGISLGSVTGRVWLDPTILVPLAGAPISAGLTVIPVVRPGVLSSALRGAKLYFQAVTVDTFFANAVLTNAAAVSF